MRINKVRVVEAMEREGIPTQTELAKRLGITKNQLSRILSNKYSPLKGRIADLCTALNIPLIMILDYEIDNASSGNNQTQPENVDAVTAIELFAGAGGLALGLEQAGIHTLEFVEIDKFCCETLKKNRPAWNITNRDVATIDFT